MNQGAGSYWGVDDFQVEGLIYQTYQCTCLLGPANSGSRVLTPHLRVRVLYAGVLIDGITVLTEYVHATFPGTIIGLGDLLNTDRDRPIFTAALTIAGLFPPTMENMAHAYLWLRAQRANLLPLMTDT